MEVEALEIPERFVEYLLDHHPVARLATLGEGGCLHQVPVVFVRFQGELWSSVDGKPKSGRTLQRVRNIQRQSSVGLLLDEYRKDWSELWWLRVEGEARLVSPEAPGFELIEKVARQLKHKYPQYESISVLRDPPLLIAIKPLRLSSWCADLASLQDRLVGAG